MQPTMEKAVAHGVLLKIAYGMMGLGAPVKKDDRGFNRPDWVSMSFVLPALSEQDADIDEDVFAFVAETLYKYHRQIPEPLYDIVVEYRKQNPVNRGYESLKQSVNYKTVAKDQATKISAKQIGELVELEFAYDQDVLTAVKKIPGVKGRPEMVAGRKKWIWSFNVVQTENAIELLSEFGNVDDLFDIADDNAEAIAKAKFEQPNVLVVKEFDNTIRVTEKGNMLQLAFDYKKSYVEAVKSLPNRKWDATNKLWTISKASAEDAMYALKAEGANVEQLEKYVTVSGPIINEWLVDFTKYPGLFDHQRVGISFLVSVNPNLRGKLLADDMGLGKTRQTIIATKEYMMNSENERALVVCPASLKINWKREIEMIYPYDEIEIVKEWNDDIQYMNWVIVNYDQLKKFEQQLLSLDWAVLILDEAHYIKNKDALRSKIVLGHMDRRKKDPTQDPDFHIGLKQRAEQIFLLTGTPITSRPKDMFNLLDCIDHPLASNYVAFVKRYCDGQEQFIKGRRTLNASGASNLLELHKKTRDAILRRVKEECLDLPEKTRQVTPVEIDLTKYHKLWSDYKRKMEKEGKILRAEHLVQLGKLRMACAIGKIPHSISIAEDIVEADQKVIIMTNYQEVVDQLMEHFGEIAVKVTGEDSMDRRQRAVDAFQNDPQKKVFVGNLKAAGVGLTLTAASQVIMNDYSWVPADHLQGEDRAMRIGQKNAVTVHYLEAQNTIDQKLTNLIANKLVVISKAIEGKEIKDNDIIGDLVFALWGDNV